jgi:phage replication-related protein YjqB (UPF0714/DUF867 family)
MRAAWTGLLFNSQKEARMSSDVYPSLAALKEHVREDAYRIRCLDRNSPVTIISPHGGFIDKGSSAVAQAIAGRRYNFFDFQGLQKEHSWELHVTSTRFRDPQLSALLDKSRFAVSIHCMGNTGDETIYLGGLNRELKELTLEALRRHEFSVNPDSPRYRGESPRNVVNLPPGRGVQIEMPTALVKTLYRGAPFHISGRKPLTTPRFDQLVTSVRVSIRDYLRSSRDKKSA